MDARDFLNVTIFEKHFMAQKMFLKNGLNLL